MKKNVFLFFIICLIAAPLMAAETPSNSFPSFGFTQEFAGTIKKGNIYVDLYKSVGSAPDIRFGILNGEIMIDSATGVTGQGIGYKMAIMEDMAAYGMLYIDTINNVTNITLGASYTGVAEGVIYNGNVEIASVNSTNTANIRGAGFLNLQNDLVDGELLVGGEIDIALSPSPSQTNLYIGGRWIPKQNILLDLGLLSSVSGSSGLTIPAFLRLNIGF